MNIFLTELRGQMFLHMGHVTTSSLCLRDTLCLDMSSTQTWQNVCPQGSICLHWSCMHIGQIGTENRNL